MVAVGVAVVVIQMWKRLLAWWHARTLGRSVYTIRVYRNDAFTGSIGDIAGSLQDAAFTSVPAGVQWEVVGRTAHDLPVGRIRIVIESRE